MEPRYNEPLYNEVLPMTNDFLYPSNSKIDKKEPRYNEVLRVTNDFLYLSNSKIDEKEPRYNKTSS